MQAAWPRMPSSAAPENLRGIDKASISKTLTKGSKRKAQEREIMTAAGAAVGATSDFLVSPRAKRKECSLLVACWKYLPA